MCEIVNRVRLPFLKKRLLLHAVRRIWFLTPLTTQPVVYVGGELRKNWYFLLDQGWLEIVGPQGLREVRRA